MNWERALPSALGALFPLGLVFALIGRPVGALVEAVLFGVLVLLLALRSRRRRPDRGWAAPATDTPSAPGAPRRGSVPRALARVETRELLLSPWFGAGIGFCVLLGAVSLMSFERSWWAEASMMPLAVHPLCGLTIMGVHRNVTRSRRDGVEELFESCPADTSARAAGHLLAGVAPVVVATLWLIITLGGAGLVFDNLYGPFDERVVADIVLAAVLLPAGAAALGVLLGRGAPFALAPLVAVIAIFVALLPLAGRGPDGYGLLATATVFEGIDPVFFDPPALGRLVWIGGLVGIVAGLALTRGRRPSPIASIGAVLALVGVVLVLRPMDGATADKLAGYAVGTDVDEECHDLAGVAELCALSPYRDHGAALAESVRPVASALPDGVIDTPLTMRFVAGDRDRLPDRVRERIDPTPHPDITLTFGSSPKSLTQARFVFAANAVGVPLGGYNYLAGGEARGVVLIWLATSGLPLETALDILTPHSAATPSDAGNIWPSGDGCAADVQWAPQDVAAARSIVALDHPTVAAVIAADWAHWTRQSTPTDELLTALGLAPLGPADPIRPQNPCG